MIDTKLFKLSVDIPEPCLTIHCTDTWDKSEVVHVVT